MRGPSPPPARPTHRELRRVSPADRRPVLGVDRRARTRRRPSPGVRRLPVARALLQRGREALRRRRTCRPSERPRRSDPAAAGPPGAGSARRSFGPAGARRRRARRWDRGLSPSPLPRRVAAPGTRAAAGNFQSPRRAKRTPRAGAASGDSRHSLDADLRRRGPALRHREGAGSRSPPARVPRIFRRARQSRSVLPRGPPRGASRGRSGRKSRRRRRRSGSPTGRRRGLRDASGGSHSTPLTAPRTLRRESRSRSAGKSWPDSRRWRRPGFAGWRRASPTSTNACWRASRLRSGRSHAFPFGNGASAGALSPSPGASPGRNSPPAKSSFFPSSPNLLGMRRGIGGTRSGFP